ncbi:MAG: hypothetical protein HW421_3284 [Ignavibacteria bacterium]|nr:hypothetical protein [Ignavibacteria bacterium]
MKTYLIILTLLVILSSTLTAGFYVLPMTKNFYGSIASGKNVLAFGDCGMYMMTTDKGNSWKKYSIDEKGAIIKMLTFNDTLWGLVDSGLIIWSVNNGISWNKHKFPLDESDLFMYFDINESCIYIRTTSKIYRYDKGFSLINSCSLSDDNTGDKFICFINNRVIASYRVGWDIYYIFLTENLSIRDSIPTFNLVKKKYILNSDKLYDKNKVIIRSYLGLYEPDSELKNWTQYIPDTLFTNPPFMPKLYNIINGRFYTLYCDKNKTKKAINDITLIFYNFGLKTYDFEKDSLVNIGNIFQNNFYTIGEIGKVSSDGITLSINSKVTILDDSLIVITGGNGMLLQSNDRAKSWNLITYLSGTPKFIFNDSSFIFFNNAKNNNEINRTSDGGLTFHPMDLVDSAVYYQQYLIAPLIYIEENGKGFFGGSNHWKSERCFGVTTDGGRSFKFSERKDLYFYDENMSCTNITKIKDKYLFAMNYKEVKNYFYIWNMDTNYNKIPLVKSDTYYTFHHLLAEDLQHFLGFATAYPKNENESQRFEIRETNDSGKTWTALHTINDFLIINQVYELNKDSVFFSALNKNRVYLYDKKRNVIDTLFSDNNMAHSNPMLMILSGKFYIVGGNLFLENTDRSNLKKWKPAAWDNGTPSFDSVLFKDNVALAKLQDSKRALNWYKITPNNSTGVIDNVEIKYYTHLYAYPPYPNPARSFVRSLVYWDLSFNLEDAVKGVYNIYGNLVCNGKNLKIDKKTFNSATIEWDCTGVESGVYFIIIDNNNRLDPIPVVVEK